MSAKGRRALVFLVAIALGTILVPMSTTLSAADPDIVGYWKFDEGLGTTAEDSSVNGNTGALVNSPLWIDGKFGKALQFDASQQQSVLVNHSETLNFAGSFSIVLWVSYTNSIDTDIARGPVYRAPGLRWW